MSVHHLKPVVQDDLNERFERIIASLRRSEDLARETERQRRHALIRAIAEADAIRDHQREIRGDSL